MLTDRRQLVLMYFRVLGQVWKYLDQVIPSVEWCSVMKARTDVIDGLGCLSNVKFDTYSDMCATTKWCGFCDLTTKRRCPPILFSFPVRIPDHLAFRGCDVKLAYGVCIYLVRVVRPPASRFLLLLLTFDG